MAVRSAGILILEVHHSPRCKKEDFPLSSAKVHYDLTDVQILANSTQKYISNAPIEAEIRYVFPLPPDASVCAFEAVINGGRKIKGVVKEKAKAKAEYEQAVAQGKTAAVLEQHNVEIFQVSLGNIKPKQTIEIHISFVAVVSHDGALDSLRLTFPSTIAPRYGTPPAGLSGPYTTVNNSALDFSVAVEMASHIKSIASPSHPIAMKLGESTIDSSAEFDPMKARISLASPTLLEKDIVVVLSCQGLDRPRCMVGSFSPEEGAQEYTDAYALTLVPRFDLPPLPSQEYIFLVDRSGSMRGGKMDAVRSALQILLISLPSCGTSFNIISFSSQHSSLWPSSVTYSAESVKEASSHVDKMKADFGGTEIRVAIEAAIKSRTAHSGDETTAITAFVLTDGQTYDLEGVQSSIHASVAEAKAGGLPLKLFCMGIGDAVSKAMCEKIPLVGQGTAAFVDETEKPDQKLMGLLRAAHRGDEALVSEAGSHGFEMVSLSEDPAPVPAPILLFNDSHEVPSETTNVGPQPIAVALSPPPRVQQAPATKSLPPLYARFRTSISATVKRGSDAPSENVCIRDSVLGRPVELAVPVCRTTAVAPASTKVLHALAARVLIQNIEDSTKHFMSGTQRAEVLRLAERYELASSQTSFVAVDELGSPVDVVSSVEKRLADDSVRTRGSRIALSSSFSSGRNMTRGSQEHTYTNKGRIIPALFVPGNEIRSVQTAPAILPPLATDMYSNLDSRGGGQTPQTADGASLGDTPVFLGFTFKRSSPESPVSTRSLDTKPETIGGFALRKQLALTPQPTSQIGIEAFSRLQSFDGSFAPSPALYQLIGNVHTPSDIDETVWCTLLCAAYLETKFAEERQVWELMVEKAVRFVEDAVGAGEMVSTLREKARECVSV